MSKIEIICREARDYEPSAKMDRVQPRWIVITKLNGKAVGAKTFNGEFPKRDARAYKAALILANKVPA